jgi:hypothetical protein
MWEGARSTLSMRSFKPTGPHMSRCGPTLVILPCLGTDLCIGAPGHAHLSVPVDYCRRRHSFTHVRSCAFARRTPLSKINTAKTAKRGAQTSLQVVRLLPVVEADLSYTQLPGRSTFAALTYSGVCSMQARRLPSSEKDRCPWEARARAQGKW